MSDLVWILVIVASVSWLLRATYRFGHGNGYSAGYQDAHKVTDDSWAAAVERHNERYHADVTR